MASTFSPSLRIELIGDGDQSGIWGQTTNNNLGSLIEQAIAGVVTITMADANYTLSNFNGVTDESRNQVIVASGTNAAVRDIIIPLVEKTYTIKNSTIGGYGVRIIGSSGTGVTVPNGVTTTVYCDGTNVYAANNGTIGDFAITGNATISGNAAVSGNATVTGNLTVTGTSNVVPAGSLLMWPTGSAPSGYLLCNGAAVSRTTYAALFAVIGTTFGAGDTTTTFNLPDYRNRMPIGAGTTAALAGTGGSADAITVAHTHTFSATSGTMNSNTTHTHTASDSGHTHTQNLGSGASQPGLTTSSSPVGAQSTTGFGYANISVSSTNIDHTHTVSGTTASTGSSGTNANLPPYLGINFVIKH
jgi:microcystin-dependent protein